MTKRVLIAGFKHETNTFSIMPTTLQSYEARGFRRGAEVAPYYKGTNTEVAAFIDGCAKHGWEPVLSIVADATPSGKLTRDCYETITGQILDDIAKAGKLDAILLNLHGAMVAEHTDDGEGTLLERIRAKVGPGVVIAATLDLHANVTQAMAKHADILVSYRTYPHIDMYDIAAEAVDIVARTLAGEVKPQTVLARRPMIDGADHGRTTSPGPMTELLDRCAAIKKSRSRRSRGFDQRRLRLGRYSRGRPDRCHRRRRQRSALSGLCRKPRRRDLGDARLPHGQVFHRRRCPGARQVRRESRQARRALGLRPTIPAVADTANPPGCCAA